MVSVYQGGWGEDGQGAARSALGAQQEDIRGQPTGNASSWSIRKILGGQPQDIVISRSSTR